MYIKNLRFKNYGPISGFNLSCRFNENGTPQPIIFIGNNGSGKSLVLSSIADSLIEFKRANYSSIPEVEPQKLYKQLTATYVKSGEDYSCVEIKYSLDGDKDAEYKEIVSTLSFQDLVKKYGGEEFKGVVQRADYVGILSKTLTNEKSVKADLDTNVLLYFLTGRSEVPAWINSSQEHLVFEQQNNLIDINRHSILKDKVTKEIEKFLLDVIFDKVIYEKKSLTGEQLKIQGLPPGLKIDMGYVGKNAIIQQSVNNILTATYKKKFGGIKHARIGVSNKVARQLSIHLMKEDGTEIMISPTFSHLSSGEIMLLGIFCSILRSYDLNNPDPIKLNIMGDAEGIVIIDEADMHLHIDLQHSSLPELIKMFPKIQFVITTHSPFFLMGLEKQLQNNYQLVNLPDGTSGTIEAFSEFVQAYDLFVEKNAQFKDSYKTIKTQAESASKPIIFTEGHTDWKHLKVALKKLRSNGQYQELDVAFDENEEDLGDATLLSCCESLSRIPNKRPMIFIFDRDNPKIMPKVNDNEGIKNWGNNVYSFSIPVPGHRQDYENISIEFYYTDEEIHTESEQGTKLYFSNEIEEIVRKNPTTKSAILESRVRDAKVEEDEKAKKIYDQDCAKVQDDSEKNAAHSKAFFAKAIYEERDNFNSFGVGAFALIFDQIKSILAMNSA